MIHPTLLWCGESDGHLELIDQTLLPGNLTCIQVRTAEETWEAIKRLAVRGAPAIGVAGAYGVVLGAQQYREDDVGGFRIHMEKVCDYLASSRPTAVNLFWALKTMKQVLDDAQGTVGELRDALLSRARALEAEDRETCARMGKVGAALIEDGDVLLTHCNAGALATCGMGTALSVMYRAHGDGRDFQVFVDETRPLFQGARLTAWELKNAGIPATLICDNMAAHAMKCRGITRVFVGADRIAANGDAANKIGTYGLAVLARAHNIPFYVVAPRSTFDLTLADGSSIPIEEREAEEITHPLGQPVAPEGMPTWAPAFDVTPAALITGIVTEWGLISPVDAAGVQSMFS